MQGSVCHTPAYAGGCNAVVDHVRVSGGSALQTHAVHSIRSLGASSGRLARLHRARATITRCPLHLLGADVHPRARQARQLAVQATSNGTVAVAAVQAEDKWVERTLTALDSDDGSALPQQ